MTDSNLVLSSLPTETSPAASRFTVVIATRNRTDALSRCLRSVLASDHTDFDIVVVDNAPDDDATERLLAQWPIETRSVIRYVREDRPGLARAHNAALPFVTGSLVAFTDDDVEIERDWLKALAAGFRRADDVACVTGMIRPAELETEAQRWIEEYAGFGKGTESRIFDLGAHRPADPLFPYTAGSMGSGANMAFTRSFLEECGGFADALGAGTLARGGDDLAAFHEVIVRGHRLVYEPSAAIRHYHHRTTEALARQLHGYGVGLGAYLTHVVATRPSSVFPMALRVIGGVAHVVGRDSTKNQRIPSTLPPELIAGERRGMLLGPWRYVRSRLRIAGENRARRGRAAR